MWAGLSTVKKERYPTSSWGEVDFELWVMLIAQDQGHPPTTALDKESFIGNMGSNHSFRNTQGSRNSRENTQGGGSGMGSNYNNGKVPKSGGICYAFNKGSCLFSPAGSDIGVPPVAATTLRSTVIHVKNSMSNSTLFDLAFTPIVYSQLHAELESYPFEADKQQLLHGFKLGFLLHHAGPRVPKEARNLKSAREAPEILKQNWPRKSP